MVRSMTAFARESILEGGKEISLEIRSVNSKYLDLQIKLPRNYSVIEDRIRKYIESSGIKRGKVDVSLFVTGKDGAPSKAILDRDYLSSYIEALYLLRDEFKLKDDISVMKVAENQLIFSNTPEALDEDELWNEIEPLLKKTTDGFISGREREGEKLSSDLLSKKNELEALRQKLLERSNVYVPLYRERLHERLKTVLDDEKISENEDRILTECAIFADKTAIDEELVRLSSHLSAFEELFKTGEPVGRKLDFLMQEINREINTSGSKCCDRESTAIVIEMKCLAEKIREQIQNLE